MSLELWVWAGDIWRSLCRPRCGGRSWRWRSEGWHSKTRGGGWGSDTGEADEEDLDVNLVPYWEPVKVLKDRAWCVLWRGRLSVFGGRWQRWKKRDLAAFLMCDSNVKWGEKEVNITQTCIFVFIQRPCNPKCWHILHPKFLYYVQNCYSSILKWQQIAKLTWCICHIFECDDGRVLEIHQQANYTLKHPFPWPENYFLKSE